MTTRQCPYCAEEIADQAIRCRHCRSRLVDLDLARWHRGHEERRLAGVAAAVAHGLAVPVGWVRAAFVLLTLVHLLGAIVYGILWAILPPAPDRESPLERALGWAHDGLLRWRTGSSADAPEARSTNNA